MAVDVRVDRGDVAERCLVELLQDRQLDATVALDSVQRFGKRGDDRRRRQRIRGGFQVGLAHQKADAAVELTQFLVAGVLDHAHDVARQHRLVHRLGVDQRQFPRIDGREVGLDQPFSADALVDELAEVAFEVGHQVGALAGQCLACIEKNRLILAHVRALGARHQKVSDAVEHRRERQLQTMDREVPAIAEYPGHVSGHRAPGGPVAGGRCHAHAFGPRWPCTGFAWASSREPALIAPLSAPPGLSPQKRQVTVAREV